MATFGVVISCLIGFTVGTLCFQNKKSAAFMLGICDIFQTFPSFVYLIPVMMLFGITDTSVLIAVVVYATIPATRYTIEGLRSVPVGLHEAATMSGVNKFQRLTKIDFSTYDAWFKSNNCFCTIYGNYWSFYWHRGFRTIYFKSTFR
jgi:glycine betaine/proline transport system permease protein